MSQDIFDTEAFVLSVIGSIPLIGDIAKDQIAAYVQRAEQERIYSAISRLRMVLSNRLSRKIDTAEIPNISNSIMLLIEKSKHEENKRKINIMTSIVGNAIILNYDQTRVQWFIKTISNISIQSVDVLHKLSAINSTQGHQFHSHSRSLNAMEIELGYSFLLALIKELSQAGLVEIRIDHSSMVSHNPRFIVFWRDVSNDFIKFLKEEQ
jgi:hypothetical protein